MKEEKINQVFSLYLSSKEIFSSKKNMVKTDISWRSSLIKALKREIIEETGIKKLKLLIISKILFWLKK